MVVVDVGHVIELYAEFTRSGATYTPFPDPRSHRIRLEPLADPAIRARLKALWTDPLSLDPSLVSARVTRIVAAELADLARSLEAAGHAAPGGHRSRLQRQRPVEKRPAPHPGNPRSPGQGASRGR